MSENSRKVEAKVISQKGSCDMGHKVGDTALFTEAGVEGKICIHALYSMMPAVFAMLFDSKFPWLKDPDVKTHACPDAYNPVVFEIRRIREDT
ncbi:TIGR04076 family protein [Acidobacteriota bacterium]